MGQFPPTGNPRVFTLSAVIIAFLLMDDFTANEQNAIGNWLMTVGQTLEANAAFQQVVEERIQGNTININSCQFKNGGSPYMNNPPLYPNDNQNSNNSSSNSKCDNSQTYKYEDEMDTLRKAIDKIKAKLDELSK